MSKAKSNTERKPVRGVQIALFEPWQVLSMCTVDNFENRKIVGSFIFVIEKTLDIF